MQEVFNLCLTSERYPWSDIYKRFSDQEVRYNKSIEKKAGIRIQTGKYVNI